MSSDNNTDNKFSNDKILETTVTIFVALVIIGLMIKVVFF